MANWNRETVLSIVDAAMDGSREVFVSASGGVLTPRKSLTASRAAAPPKGYRRWSDVPEVKAELSKLGLSPKDAKGLRAAIEQEQARKRLGNALAADDRERDKARRRLSSLLASSGAPAQQKTRKPRRDFNGRSGR